MIVKIGIIHNNGRMFEVWKLLERSHQVSLISKGVYDVLLYGLQHLELSDLEGVKGKYIVCGSCSDEVKELGNVICLLENESFLQANAIVTAWGIVEVLLRHSQQCLDKIAVDVIGYGRCGKALVKLLEDLHVEYRVVVRSLEDVQLQFMHYEEYLFHTPYQWIVMTSENCIFDKYWVERYGKFTQIIDITSQYKGTLKIQKENIGILYAKGLPDVYCTKSGAIAYVDSIKEILV